MSPRVPGFRLEQGEISIAALDETDIPAMMMLEADAAPYPWTRGQYATCIGTEYGLRGGWYGGELVGFIVDWRVLDEGHLMNLCVHGSFQQQGIGRYLLRYWLAVMQREGMASLTLEVRESNSAARRLYASEGFEDVGVRPDYYRTKTGTEAARIMTLQLDGVRAAGR